MTIALKGVELSFEGLNRNPILERVSFEARTGEIVGLVGENGAGKTTLLKLCAGIIKPSGGQLLIGADAKPLSKLNSRQLAQTVAYMPQNPESHSFNAYDAVMMGRYNRARRFMPAAKQDHAATQAALETAAVSHLAERKFDTLSGGEQRRVVFARALAQEAQIMLLDEPTADLDLNHRNAAMETIKREARRGRAVVIALHDLELALRYCERVYMLRNGAVYAHGETRAVITPANVKAVFGVDIVIAAHPADGAPSLSVIYPQNS